VISIIEAQQSMKSRGELVEQSVLDERPELLDLFFTYQNEAIASRSFLDKNLKKLDGGDEILEVGGGILALAVQLASEGFKITTVEPVGDGFGGIHFMMQKYQEIAQDEHLPISLINMPIEHCSFNQKFKFIFLINVMEHLSDTYSVLIQLTEHLRADGKYRFFCPNYDFPYEPHFSKLMFTRTNGSFRLRVNRARTETLSQVSLPHCLNRSIS